MLTPTLDADDVARTFRVLRKLDPDSVKVLRTGLRNDLKGTAKAIAGEYPAQPLLSGFQQTFGRWDWGKVTGTVKVTPGKSRKGAGRQSVVSLSMNYRSATPFVMDMFGQRSTGRTPQGRNLYRVLQDRVPGWPNGGRIFYGKFLRQREAVISRSVDIINKWSDDVTKELSRGN
jgi:hypothetical protein